VSFAAAAGTLKGKVSPEAGVKHTTRFTATQAGFDRKSETLEDPAQGGRPARTGRCSDDIGKVVKTADGTEASYTLSPDDLYVRAAGPSSRRALDRASNEPEHDTAWTQPYGWREWQARNPFT